MPPKPRFRAAPATLGFLTVILALVGVALVALTGAEAAGQGQPKCGDTITADTTLHKDLVNCPNNGLLIGADNVTLDLKGHTIDGDGAPTAGCDPVAEFCDFGVGFENHDGITVKHGSIHQFVTGFGAFTSRHARLLDISASRNQGVGITLGGDARILVRNCSGDRSAFGLGFGESRHVRILHCSFRHTAHVGIVTDDSNNNLIKGNLFSHNGEEAVLINGGGAHNTVRNNLVKNSHVDGFVVKKKDRHSRLKGNTAKGAGDDGFDIASRSATLTGNRANRNGDLGIEAVRGVNDGGGNIAHHNGDPRQCTHIVCH